MWEIQEFEIKFEDHFATEYAVKAPSGAEFFGFSFREESGSIMGEVFKVHRLWVCAVADPDVALKRYRFLRMRRGDKVPEEHRDKVGAPSYLGSYDHGGTWHVFSVDAPVHVDRYEFERLEGRVD